MPTDSEYQDRIGDNVSYALERRSFVGGLDAKFRHCVEHADPNHELRRVEFR